MQNQDNIQPQITTSSEPSYISAEKEEWENQLHSGTNWFYWIAGLSLATSVMQYMGSNRAFLVGLGITQVLDGVFSAFGDTATVIALVFDVFIAGFLIACGYFGGRKQMWAIVIGLGFYLLDTLLLVAIAVFFGEPQLILSIGFHAFVLYRLFSGFSACRELQKLDAEVMTTSPPPPPQSF
jgi:hypothetical protein